MDEKLRELFALAFRTAGAREANEAIGEVRAAGEQGGPAARSYEVLVPDGAGFEWLRDTALPRLVYHLESLRARPPGFAGLVLSLFVGEKLLFIRAADFLPAAGRLAGLTVDQLYERFGTRETRTAVREGGTPLLPPPKPE